MINRPGCLLLVVPVLFLALLLWRVLAELLHNQRMLDMLAAYGQSVAENSPARLMSEEAR